MPRGSHKRTTRMYRIGDVSTASRCTDACTDVADPRAIRTDVSEYRPSKRRKVTGLNRRFDRMIRSVNTLLSYRTGSPVSSRKRMQSSGTSSVSSHDIPKTPVNVYSNYDSGKLGKDFSVLKTGKLPTLPRDDSDGSSNLAAPPLNQPRGLLPVWLADTFDSLEADHPLRGLLSPSRIHAESHSSPSGRSREEGVFAFSPFNEQQETPDADYRANTVSNVQGNVPSVVHMESTLPHVQHEASNNPLPFSTPGHCASVRSPRSTRNSVVDRAAQRPVVTTPWQLSFQTMSVTHPTFRSRSDNVIGRSRAFLVRDIAPPSDLQAHGANLKRHRLFYADCDNQNVYVTPGPTFACSRPVYFDSPTEDPSLSDPLQPESYELDLNAIDFRWRPFLRSNTSASDMKRRPVTPTSPLGDTAPYRITMGDQNGGITRCTVDKEEYGASSEDLTSLAGSVDLAYLNGNARATTTESSTIGNTTGLSSTQTNDTQEVLAAVSPQRVYLSPARGQLGPTKHVLPRAGGETMHTGKEHLLSRGKMKLIGSKILGKRPSTPTRQAPVSPPSTPQKLRTSQFYEMPRLPVCKASSAFSWMVPLKPSKRSITVRDDVDRRLSCISADSHDSIESWSQTS